VEFGLKNTMVVRTNQTHEERRLLPPWPMAIKNITNMLGLKGFKVSDTPEEEEAFVIEVQVKPNKTAVCPECSLKDLYRHGKAKPKKIFLSCKREFKRQRKTKGRRAFKNLSEPRKLLLGQGTLKGRI